MRLTHIYQKKPPSLMPVHSKRGSEKSIAVLPFRNLSNNSDDRYIYDGVNGRILTILAGYMI